MSGKVKIYIKKIIYSSLFIQIAFLQSAVDGVVPVEQTIASEQNTPAVPHIENVAPVEHNNNEIAAGLPVAPAQDSTSQPTTAAQAPIINESEHVAIQNDPVPAVPITSDAIKPLEQQSVAVRDTTTSQNVVVPVSAASEQEHGTLQDEAQVPPADVNEPPLIGIDTVTLEEPQGNWLFKRIWWERAQETYEKVRILVAQIMDYRMEFFMHRSEINRAVLDPFYAQVGFAQGQLKEVVERVLQGLQDEKNSALTLNASERALSSDVETIKDILERFKVDVEMVDKLDGTIDKALEQLVTECNKVRSYEQEAWQSYKQIGQELSDSKARELFYHLDVHMRYIKDIQRYLQQDFARYFQDLIRQISSETERLLGVVNKLKEQGVDFKKQLTKNAQELHADLVNELPAFDDDQSQEDTVVAKRGFFGELKLKVGLFFSNVKDLFVKSVDAVYRLFGGKKDVIVESEY